MYTKSPDMKVEDMDVTFVIIKQHKTEILRHIYKQTIHEGAGPYGCNQCEYKSSQTVDLKAHKKRKHTHFS